MRQVLKPLMGPDADRDHVVDEAVGQHVADRPAGSRDRTKWWARVSGGLFLAGGAAHIVLVSGWSHTYDSFAAGSNWSFIGHAWRSALVPNVHVLIPLLAAFEVTVGFLILVWRTRRIGIACALGFSVALMLFGFGFWAWSFPVIALLAYFWHLESLGGARRDPIGGDP